MKAQFSFDMQCDEARIQETIDASRAAFLAGEAEQIVSPLEFLVQQSRYIRKRLWLVQGALLAFVCLLMYNAKADFFACRILGLAGSLFAILIYPEFWKNRSCDAVEIECTTLYSLRSIYAARLTLFGGADAVMLSAFFACAACLTPITLGELFVQFLLPFNVTCCICFRTLYSRRIHSEALSLLLCVVWAGVWSLFIWNDAVFRAISGPMWLIMLAASFLGMAYILCRGQKLWHNTLEVKSLWT